MDLDEFRDGGYLQEVNRLFFHPLGLALAVRYQDGHVVALDCILDNRDDPEGWIFGEGDAEARRARAANVEAQRQRMAETRRVSLGYEVQTL